MAAIASGGETRGPVSKPGIHGIRREGNPVWRYPNSVNEFPATNHAAQVLSLRSRRAAVAANEIKVILGQLSMQQCTVSDRP